MKISSRSPSSAPDLRSWPRMSSARSTGTAFLYGRSARSARRRCRRWSSCATASGISGGAPAVAGSRCRRASRGASARSRARGGTRASTGSGRKWKVWMTWHWICSRSFSVRLPRRMDRTPASSGVIRVSELAQVIREGAHGQVADASAETSSGIRWARWPRTTTFRCSSSSASTAASSASQLRAALGEAARGRAGAASPACGARGALQAALDVLDALPDQLELAHGRASWP